MEGSFRELLHRAGLCYIWLPVQGRLVIAPSSGAHTCKRVTSDHQLSVSGKRHAQVICRRVPPSLRDHHA